MHTVGVKESSIVCTSGHHITAKAAEFTNFRLAEAVRLRQKNENLGFIKGNLEIPHHMVH